MAAIHPSGIAQAALRVDDLDRAKSFYGEAIGLPHLFDAPPSLAFYQCGATRLMLSAAEGPPTGEGTILYLGVEDVIAAHRSLAERGTDFISEPHQVGEVEGRPIHLAVCRDGVGNVLGLISG